MRYKVTKKNTFKTWQISPQGRLIDGTKDVTEKDLAEINYRKLQSEQFDPMPKMTTGSVVSAIFFALGMTVILASFTYILIKYVL